MMMMMMMMMMMIDELAIGQSGVGVVHA